MLPQLLYFGATFALSCALSLYLTPFIRRSAIRYNVLDHPDDHLKSHNTATPYLGGIAVYLAFLLTLSLVFNFQREILGLLLAGSMLTMMGLFDDLKVLTPILKLLGQLLATWVVIRSDIMVQLVAAPLWVQIALTIFWLIAITNSLNVIDVSDGLATGTSIIAATSLFIIAVLNGQQFIATTALALVGACAGFFRYNQPPAQIFLGDAGSLFIGFMLAALSMIGQYTTTNYVSALAPLCILCVPIGELTLVSISRIAKGRSPLFGSPDHFAVRLRHAGWSPRKIAAWAYAVGIYGGASGVAIVAAPPEYSGWIVSGVVAVCASLLVILWMRYPAPSSTTR